MPYAPFSPELASPAAQARRREDIFARLRAQTRDQVTRTDGRTVIPVPEHVGDWRLHLWLAHAWLAGEGEDRAIGNELLAGIPFTHACHFVAAGCGALLMGCRDRLTDAAAANCEHFLRTRFGDLMTRDYSFQGANDNAPSGCVTGLSLGGSYFGNETLVEFARAKLRRMDHLLDLRGYINEFVSGTYSAITLMDIADLVEYTPDAETRELALRLEQRVWQEVLLHFHPRLRHVVGPHSRAYNDDKALQCGCLMMTYYAAFGEITWCNPLAMLFPPPADTFAHNAWSFQYRQLAGIMAPTYHPPLELAAAAFARDLPYAGMGTNEWMGHDGIPASQSTVQTWLTDDYGVGTCGSRVASGQTVPLHVLCRRRDVPADAPVAEHLGELRSIHTRMTVSDRPETMYVRDEVVDQDVGSDHGCAFSVQHQGTTLLGYVPHGAWSAAEICTIRTSLVLATPHSRPDEVWFGKRPIEGFSAAFQEDDWCFLREGDVYLGILPLVQRRGEMHLAPTMFTDAGKWCLISFNNIASFTRRRYCRDELRSFGGGMVVEVGTKAEYGDFAAFREAMNTATLTDETWPSDRWLRYRRGNVDLELCYDFLCLNLRRAAVNGRLVSEAVKLETTPELPLVP